MKTAALATAGALGFDTDTRLTAKNCADFRAGGYAFVVRYLRDLNSAEAATILASGLALMGVGHVRFAGWRPTQGMGAIDGANAVNGAHVAGLAAGTTLWVDLEGVADTVPAADVAAYVNAWAASVRGAEFEPGLYVGYHSILSSAELFHDLTVTRYWRSGSSVPDVEVRGYCLVQHSPLDVTQLGVRIDVDSVQADSLGGLPTWTVETADNA